MKSKIAILCLTFLLSVNAFGQIAFSEDQFRVFDGKGNALGIAEIVKAASESDVVFLGEEHDDAVCHAIQMEIFRRLVADFAAKRKVTLSLEMFERDVQIVLNEYLKGLITEPLFLSGSRPWGNYKTDYRPLVELAKEKGIDVVAANAPRRYVNMVSRNGRDALNGLSKEAKKWLAPLPYAEPSAVYAKKFTDLMAGTPGANSTERRATAVHSQALWDATMADSVAKSLKRKKGSLVVHLNGGFHTESRLGTVEHLLKYRSKARVLVVTIRTQDEFKTFDKVKHTGLGDFVILTDGKQPRSKRN